MKTQQLNTIFTSNAGPAMGEVQRLAGSINSALSSVFARAQSIQNISRSTGMGQVAAQAAARMGATTGISGYGEAVAQMSKFNLMGVKMGERAAGRLGVDDKAFGAADAATQFDMLAEGLSKITDKKKRWRAAARTGLDADVLMQRAGQYEANPVEARKARDAAQRAQLPPDVTGREEQVGLWKRRVGGELKDAVTSGLQKEIFSKDETNFDKMLKDSIKYSALAPSAGIQLYFRMMNKSMTRMIEVLTGIHDNTK